MSVHHPHELLVAAMDLLHKIDNMTTEDFAKGAARKEREALRQAIADARGWPIEQWDYKPNYK